MTCEGYLLRKVGWKRITKKVQSEVVGASKLTLVKSYSACNSPVKGNQVASRANESSLHREPWLLA